MLRLGIRLTLRGGREAGVRLLMTAFAVTVGVAIMLGVLSLFNAYQSTTARPCWECSPTMAGEAPGFAAPGPGPAAPVDPAAARREGAKELWNFSQDFYQGTELRRLDVAALTADAPTIPGLTAVPGPGEYYVSPALSHLLATAPHDQLADRFPGHAVGLIGDAALTGPDELVVVIGHTPEDLAQRPATEAVTAVSTVEEAKGTTVIYRFGFAFGTVALLLPIVFMVGTATRLSAARREERYAAMRLVGATPRQVGLVASAESFIGAALGTVGGVLLHLALSGQVAKVNVTGSRFFPDQVSPHLWGYLAVLILVPALAAFAALRSLRRVQYDPLAVSRKATPKPPSAWRLVPLVLGAVLFAFAIGTPAADSADAFMYPALIFTLGGIVSAGPWVTLQASRLLGRFAAGAASTLAARRLADDPRATYRVVSGVTVAVFVGTAVAGFLPSAMHAGASGQRAPLVNVLRLRYDLGPTRGLSSTAAATVVKDLHGMPGVETIPVYAAKDPSGWSFDSGTPRPADWQPPLHYVSCADAEALPVLGTCAPGQAAAVIADDALFVDDPLSLRLPVIGYSDIDRATGAKTAAPVPTGVDLSGLDVSTLMVAAPDRATLERARTYLDLHAPVLIGMGSPEEWSSNAVSPMTFGELAALREAVYRAAQQMIVFAVVLTLFVAGCSIAVATAGSLVERKRPFTLLRLSGTSMAVLCRVVFLESALPLVTVSAMAGLTAYAMALAAVRSLAPNTAMTFPAGAYATTAAAVILGALTVILGSMTLLSRMTRSENVRFE